MKRGLLVILLLFNLGAARGQSGDFLDIRGIVEAHLLFADSPLNWYRGGFGKLRYDDDTFPMQLGTAAIHTDLHFSDSLWLRTLITAHTYPGFDPNLVEAYFNYRPVPRGTTRIRVKAGAFHLPLSLENRGLGWTSLYSITPSVINTWVGEELRVLGTEVELEWPGRYRRSAHGFALVGGLYGFNDGVGTLLAYRGWANHDRQTGIEDKLRLVPDPEGSPFREFDPFWEIDDRVGYYLGGTWSYLDRLELKFMHYDNRTDPTARQGRQLAWKTRFEHVSVELELPLEIKLLGQFITGNTYINNLDDNTASDTDYQAWYVLLSRRTNRHRYSVRYESFRVEDHDNLQTTVHNSNEDGWSWMLSYRYQVNRQVQLGVEWLQIHSNKAARLLTLGYEGETENQLLTRVNYRF